MHVHMCICALNIDNPVMFILTIVGGSGTPTTTTPPGNTGKLPPISSGSHISSTSNVTMQPDGMSHVRRNNISTIENR